MADGRNPAGAQEDHKKQLDPENTIVMQLETGQVLIELFPDKAPGHVARIKELARERFYDGIVFHRVIDGFMAQTGDPTGTGMGGSKKPDLKAEFNDMPHHRGTVSMARTSDPNSANSQFFIMFEDGPNGRPGWPQLDRQYTAFGQVVQGMDAIDKIHRGEPPASPTHIVAMRVVADVLREQQAAGGGGGAAQPANAPKKPNIDILSPVLAKPGE
ncbi:MAG: peptidylprolyl isomerase [Alphaproteobacteria bacterium]|nr:peptidylprolyl isomerase [Alphaproteobacteria bacterium]